MIAAELAVDSGTSEALASDKQQEQTYITYLNCTPCYRAFTIDKDVQAGGALPDQYAAHSVWGFVRE